MNITASVYQNATGDGDNIARDKTVIVYQKLAPEALRKPIEKILSSVRERKKDVAKIQLETIKATELDSNSKAIIDMLSIHLDLLEDDESPKIHSALLSAFNISTDSVLRDLYLAILIKLDAKYNRTVEARERYLKADILKTYSQEAFYEFVATVEELKQAYEENRINLDESQLNGLIRGAFRSKQFELSLIMAKRLNEVFPSFNSKVLFLVATACDIEIKLGDKHFWTICFALKSEIYSLIDKVVCMINESKGTDPRLFNIAVPFWYKLRREHEGLNEVCCRYISEVEKGLSEIEIVVRKVNIEDMSGIDDIDSKFNKARGDMCYRDKLLSDIFKKMEVSNDDFVIISHFADRDRLRMWVASGGKIIEAEDIITGFNRLKLLLLALPNKMDFGQNSKIEEINDQAKQLIGKHEEQLCFINPVYLLDITERLVLHPKLAVIACDLIRPILPASDLWASPIVESYLNALLVSQQMATLFSILSNINQDEWNSFIWQVQARLFEKQYDFSNAIMAIDEALKRDSNLLDAWHFLVYLHRKQSISDSDLALILKDIPEDVLLTNSNKALGLLIEIAKTGDFARAENIILSWFIRNPITCATEITNFEFACVFDKISRMPTHEKVGDCIVGVIFKRDSKVLTKLLTSQSVNNHECLLNINSELGGDLYKMKIGETKKSGMYDITLLERLPPYVAAFQISLQLRDTQNDGSDCFFASKAPDNPNDLLALLERRLTDTRGCEDAFNNIEVPLFCKGLFLNRDNSVKAALKQLTAKKPIPLNLPNFGEKDVSDVVLDVYAITYLAITGLFHGIGHASVNFVITRETKVVIEQWLAEINRDEYLSVGVMPGGGLWKVTADEVRQSTQYIQNAFGQIIDKVKIINPNLVDMPPLMLSIQSIVDASVYSSACLTISNNIPWLCIDEIFAYFIKEFGYRQINVVQFLVDFGSSVAFENKKNGLYLYADQIVPYAVSLNDLRLLSISDDEYAHYFLAKIIRINSKYFSSTKAAAETLVELLVPVLRKAYHDGNILRGMRVHNPMNNGHAEKVFNACCYVSMQCDDGDIAERKLAVLLYRLFLKFNAIPPMLSVLQAMALTFITGHFMDMPKVYACIKEEYDKSAGRIKEANNPS